MAPGPSSSTAHSTRPASRSASQCRDLPLEWSSHRFVTRAAPWAMAPKGQRNDLIILEAVVKITMLGRRAITGAAALSLLLGGVAVAATGSGSAETPSEPTTTLPGPTTTVANEHAHVPATVAPGSDAASQTAPTTTSPSTHAGVGSGAAQNHGACVSAVARVAPAQAGGSGGKPADPSAHGRAVSAAAHSCPKPDGAAAGPHGRGHSGK